MSITLFVLHKTDNATDTEENGRPYLKDMESFELNISTLFPQHVHHEFEIIWIGNVTGHRSKIMSI